MRRFVVISLLLAITALVAGVQFVDATLTPSTFEGNDGNLVVVGTNAKDWATIDPYRQDDKPTGHEDDSFGQGSDENNATPTAVTGSIPNNKSDLTRFYIANERVTPSSGSPADFLYLAWARVQDPTGTTNMDFELNKNKCVYPVLENGQTSTTPTADSACSSNKVTPERLVGDRLIKFDLANGGTNVVMGWHKWIASSEDEVAGYGTCQAGNKYPCWGKVHDLTGHFEGNVNASVAVDSIANTSYSARTFGEAAVNLTSSGIFGSGCETYGSVYLKSRSSDSFTAALKDFIRPKDVNITNCGSIKIRKTGDQGNGYLEGTKFALYKRPGTTLGSTTGAAVTATSPASGGTLTLASGGAAAAGLPATAPFKVVVDREVISITSRSGDTLTVGLRGQDDSTAATHESGAPVYLLVDSCAPTLQTVTVGQTSVQETSCNILNIPFGSYGIVEIKWPNGYSPHSADDSISVSSATRITKIYSNNRLPIDINLEKRNDDATPGGVPICTSTTQTGCARFTLYKAGQTVSLSSASGVTDSATTFDVTTSGTVPLPTGPAIVGKEIVDVTAATTSSLTVVRSHLGTTASTHATGAGVTSLTASATACAIPAGGDAADGNCTFASIPTPAAGSTDTYWVVETTTPAGFGTATPEAVQVTLGGGNKSVRMTDPRLYRVLVFVCRQSDSTLKASPATLAKGTAAGAATESKTTAAAADLPQGVTEAALCGMTAGASFSGRTYTATTSNSVPAYAGTVKINQ